MGRKRRLGPHHTALAFEALQKGGFFAADIGPGPDAQFQLKGTARAQNVGANQSDLTRQNQGLSEGDIGVGIF